jgi:isopentenyl phosphate kinase
MSELIFLKLGGSLITDKTSVETVRPAVLARIAAEVRQALKVRNELALLIGHGSGSFGHIAAAKYGTRQGVHTRLDWLGFAEVSSAAARLNALVREALIEADVPAVTFQPSASAICEDGRIVRFSYSQIQKALREGLVPLVYGDVAIDRIRGGTIISTEEILSYIAPDLQPHMILLAGETEGVLSEKGEVVPFIHDANIDRIRQTLGGSRGTDVTGGMASKVEDMINLATAQPSIKIRIFSGMIEGAVEQCLARSDAKLGTLITAH